MKRFSAILLAITLSAMLCITAYGKNSYLITTPQQLASIKDAYGSYQLGANIDMTGVTYNNKNFFQFYGTFDGAGYTISNLTLNYNQEQGATSLLGALQPGSVVKNLTLSNCTINGTRTMYLSFLASSNNGTIENCHIKASTINATGATFAEVLAAYQQNQTAKTSAEYVHCPSQMSIAGLTPSGDGIIKNSTVQMTVRVPTAANSTSIVAMNSAFISDSTADCIIQVDKTDGQLAIGMFGGQVADAQNCTAMGSITVGEDTSADSRSRVTIGGFVTSHSGGEVTDPNNPLLNRKIANCTSAVNIDCRNIKGDIGGFVASFQGPYTKGYGSNSITSCTASGTLNVTEDTSGPYRVGEFVGYFSLQTMRDCKSTASLTVDGSTTDSFAGRVVNPLVFENCN